MNILLNRADLLPDQLSKPIHLVPPIQGIETKSLAPTRQARLSKLGQWGKTAIRCVACTDHKS